MGDILSDPGTLALVFGGTVFALTGALALSGAVRLATRARGRVLHALTLAAGAVALGVLVLSAAGVDLGLGAILGLAAGVVAVPFWLMGALAARVRPAWVDLLVIVAALAYFTAYAQIAEAPGGVPPIFLGIAPPGDVP
ncbi:hypothetical protein [Roseicyclus persicicus]|uniref:Uncharacterized protein n=1 Tax=Roseicyclus persicicus TaxID=2650661 RepID=A0A7X6JZT4_9RHOB|nr:hypothetical protein [Roseibacterium persicicum]NKX45884.1 hypothetical protein [Roseibacterium persicicum]